MILIVVLLFLGLFSLGVITEFFVSTIKTFKKFDSLNADAQEKIKRIEYYMALVRNFSREELNTLRTLTEKEIEYCNAMRDRDKCIQKIGKKIHAENSGRFA
jgi:Sec-independent protein translocase protein TatA